VPEEDTVMVFTARSPDRIVAEGGSQAWTLNPARAKLARWLVCTQNRHNPDHEFSDATEPHGAAFLVGKISGIKKSQEEGSEDRWIIEISEYARIIPPMLDAWEGWRNPIRYLSLEDLKIDVTQLTFKKMSEQTGQAKGGEASAGPVSTRMLTIAEAKKALAETYGVKPEAIEITIRG
jgi:hypothetical protein